MSNPARDASPGINNAKAEFPDWCDLGCPWAEFPRVDALDGARSCRTFVALHCRYLNRPVAKNSRCEAKRGRGPAAEAPPGFREPPRP